MIRLLALDVDGTVLREDGTIAPKDTAAVRRALDHGIHVILCTGRILSGTRAVARELGLRGELVCAGGSSITEAVTGEIIECHPVDEPDIDAFLAGLSPELAPFLLSDEVVHHDGRGERYLPYVSTWIAAVQRHADLDARVVEEPILAKIFLGPRDAVEATVASLRQGGEGRLMALSFPANLPGGLGQHVGLVRRPRTKGDALRSLARRRGLEPRHLAAVGDWLNDVPMFAAVGRSFVMGQADEETARHATERLLATDRTGGGVAEAVGRLLG